MEFCQCTSHNDAISHMLFSGKNGQDLAVSRWARLLCKAGFKPAVFRAFYVFRQGPIRQLLQDFLMCIESFYDRCATLLAHDRQCFRSRARLALWTIYLGSSCPKPIFVKFLALKALKLLTNQF